MTEGLESLLSRFVATARAEDRDVLLEHEGMALLAALGIQVPRNVLLPEPESLRGVDLEHYRGERVVLKIVAQDILHKSDVGGVRIVPRQRALVAQALEEMLERFADSRPTGVLLCEFVEYEPGFDAELLLGMHHTADFGPVVTVGAGGIHTEFVAEGFAPGEAVAILTPELRYGAGLPELLRASRPVRLALDGARGRPGRLRAKELEYLVRAFLENAAGPGWSSVHEIEINPLALTESGPVALDCLIRLQPAARDQGRAPRPLAKIARLLQPSSLGIIGVSSKLNPGRIILQNTLAAGFDPQRIHVVKPGSTEIDGCRCVPDVASLPEKVDLFICAVAAAQVPGLVAELVRQDRAESLIVIPGGLEESDEGSDIATRMHEAIRESRGTSSGGPVINGGNCLGIRSLPGRYDTLFIPQYKLPPNPGPASPTALLSQSGAFAVAQASKLAAVNPEYLITFGNQSDLTIGDYLEHLKDDPELRDFACYVEGFQPGDGRRFLSAAREITSSGRRVFLYRSGRTSAGAAASASHTASIAGEYEVTRQLAAQAGVVVVDALEDFRDLLLLSSFLGERRAGGPRLAALSNAGFECVAIADHLGEFRLAEFSDSTNRGLEELFASRRVQEIVTVHNPLDLTPILDDEAYEEAVRLLVTDSGVDLAVVGCVPLTGALATLPPGEGHGEDFRAEGGVGPRLVRLFRESSKPFLLVVDSGSLYDPFAEWILSCGVPCVRSADRALRLLRLWYGAGQRAVGRA